MKVKEIRAINGPYPPTFEGILRAIGECYSDQELGETSSNNKIVAVHENGGQKTFLVPLKDILTADCWAADIAHHLGIEHYKEICLRCSIKRAEEEAGEEEDFWRSANSLLN